MKILVKMVVLGVLAGCVSTSIYADEDMFVEIHNKSGHELERTQFYANPFTIKRAPADHIAVHGMGRTGHDPKIGYLQVEPKHNNNKGSVTYALREDHNSFCRTTFISDKLEICFLGRCVTPIKPSYKVNVESGGKLSCMSSENDSVKNGFVVDVTHN